MSRLVKLAPSQTPLRQVMQPAHNADFCRLSISKHPANAHNINNFSPLAVQDDYTGGGLSPGRRIASSIAILVNNAFKTVQQSAKDKEDI